MTSYCSSFSYTPLAASTTYTATYRITLLPQLQLSKVLYINAKSDFKPRIMVSYIWLNEWCHIHLLKTDLEIIENSFLFQFLSRRLTNTVWCFKMCLLDCVGCHWSFDVKICTCIHIKSRCSFSGQYSHIHLALTSSSLFPCKVGFNWIILLTITIGVASWLVFGAQD